MATRRLQKEWANLQAAHPSHGVFYRQYHTQYQQFSQDFPNINKDLGYDEVPATISLTDDVAGIFPQQTLILFPSTPGNATGNANTATLFNHWISYINGPEETPYHGFRFELRIEIPHDYPHGAPKVAFLTPIFHPNIDFSTGEICLDILKNNWSPVWTLEATVRAIYLLLSQSETDSPLNLDAANILRNGDVRGFYSLARAYCLDSAIPIKLDIPVSPRVDTETTLSTNDQE